jgi:hypothetical protein
LQTVRSVTIVGGGLFPRTALILGELLPDARLIIVDSDAENLKTARGFLDGNVDCRSIEYDNKRYVPGESRDCDLTVIPLCLEGDRAAIYSHPPSPAVLVHDWIWRPRGTGMVVSAALLKRLNLVTCSTRFDSECGAAGALRRVVNPHVQMTRAPINNRRDGANKS